MKAIVIGATGQIGHAVCRALAGKGYEVVACHRGRRELQPDLKQAGCREVVGDRHDSEGILRELKRGADLLVDVVPMIQADAEQLLSHDEGFGAIVAVSTAAVYADDEGRSLGSAPQTGFPEFPGAIGDGQRTVEPDGQTYAGRKVAIERLLLGQADCDVTILRPCAIHGIYTQDLREVWFLKRLLDGRNFIPLAYDGASRFHTCAASTVAAAIVASAEAGGTRTLNVADGDAPTALEIGRTLLKGASSVEMVCLSGPPKDWVGMTPWSVASPIRLDTSSLAALIGTPLSYEETVRPTAAWAEAELKRGDWAGTFPKLAAYPFPLFDYDAEDAFLRGRASA